MKRYRITLLFLAVATLGGIGAADERAERKEAPPDTPPPSTDTDEETGETEAPPTPPSDQTDGDETDEAIPPPPSAESLQRRIDQALMRLAGEPTLLELQQAALRLADADAAQTRSWQRRPRTSAMLPTLKLTADYDLGRDETLDRYQERPDRWGADTDRAMGFQASAQWHLNELVFNADEVRVYNALADRAGRREGLQNLLIGYYFERRRLQLETLLVPPQDMAEALDREMRIRQLTASIDALTGGLLSSKIQSGRR